MNNQPQISVIIPVFNEAKVIRDTLSQFDDDFCLEIIVVDSGSSDHTQEIVRFLGQTNSQLHLIISLDRGRAKQMNYGAKFAKGEILLFLHADTHLPKNYQEIIKQISQKKTNILGAFKLAIAGKEACLRIVEWLVNWRSQLFALPYGDQAIFLTKQNFQLLGGFPELPIMEDFELVKQAKKHGKVEIASTAVITSARRWQKLGVWKTTLINQVIIIGYYLRIPLEKLRWFYCYFA